MVENRRLPSIEIGDKAGQTATEAVAGYRYVGFPRIDAIALYSVVKIQRQTSLRARQTRADRPA
ncbi:hypothetical protein [Sphingobium chlorophenolicum]|uniref:hypothetical protein n=1 Tax=Sphingobium chlorophenolicum TaxID=46429 RepID=UPI0012DD9FE9|nr:hypothetical protein [Sphingobium chlorophenolicum]